MVASFLVGSLVVVFSFRDNFIMLPFPEMELMQLPDQLPEEKPNLLPTNLEMIPKGYQERKASNANANIRTSAKANVQVQDDDYLRLFFPNKTIKVPFPVFVASLPKSGTTSVHNYFICGNIRSSHTYCPDNGDRIGNLIRANILNGLPPLQGCGNANHKRHGPVKVFTDTGNAPPGGPCYYPTVSSLDELYQSYPNMTILLGTRDVNNWYHSLKQWGRGRMFRRWAHYCSFMPKGRKATKETYINFYVWHTEHVRNFTRHHPSLTYVEFSIDSPNASLELEHATGISASCWGHHRPPVFNASVAVSSTVTTIPRIRTDNKKNRRREGLHQSIEK
jgi:hypothetical protein